MALSPPEDTRPQESGILTYEIVHGQRTHFIQAGNPWAACLGALHAEAEDDDVQQSTFGVTSLLNGEERMIPMADVLAIGIMAVNAYVPGKRVAPRIDLNHW